jgi:hypothetical protein
MTKQNLLRQPNKTARALLPFAALVAASPGLAQPQTCPLEGDAKQALAKQLNPYKNREDAPPVPKINIAATLPAVLGSGNDLHRWSREDGAIFEGVVVGVKVGGVESVNCHAKDPAHRDTHIELALDPAAPETQRVIVEVTPRWREKMAVIADWSTTALTKQLLGRRVRITGWLFDDLEHERQAENSNPGGAGNWRATVWEIHPVTGIAVLPGGAAAVTVAARSSLPKPAHHRKKARRRCTRSKGHVCHKAPRARTGTHA